MLIEIGNTYTTKRGRQLRVIDISVSATYSAGIVPIITYQNGAEQSTMCFDSFRQELEK